MLQVYLHGGWNAALANTPGPKICTLTLTITLTLILALILFYPPCTAGMLCPAPTPAADPTRHLSLCQYTPSMSAGSLVGVQATVRGVEAATRWQRQVLGVLGMGLSGSVQEMLHSRSGLGFELHCCIRSRVGGASEAYVTFPSSS